MGTPTGPMNSSGALKPPAYAPMSGTPSGIPGASYPVLGSAPITNQQPRYSQPGSALIRPGMAPPQTGMPPPQQQSAPVGGMNPQMLAAALGRLSGQR